MGTQKKIFGRLVALYPSVLRDRYSKMLTYAGKKTSVTKRLGRLSVVMLVSFVAVMAGTVIFFPKYMWFGVAAAFLAAIGVFLMDYLLLYFIVEDRKEKLEKVLPDFLHLLSSNMRAGFTPYQALKYSGRDEFGPLKEAVEIATTNALGSGSFKEALQNTTKRFNSIVYERVVNLFITSMRSGSHMAELMEETARDIAETRSLKKDLSTGTKTYTMFILFTVIIGSPLLYSISLHFVDIMSSNQFKAPTSDDSFELGIGGGGMSISKDFIFGMSIFMIVSTSIFSSLLIGVVQEGKKARGLRYAPLIAIASLAILFVARMVVGSFFSL